jgi:hypothetical protein
MNPPIVEREITARADQVDAADSRDHEREYDFERERPIDQAAGFNARRGFRRC